MNAIQKLGCAAAVLLFAATSVPSEARGFRAAGPRGVIGAGRGPYVGPFGGHGTAAGGGFATRNSGFLAGRFNGVGPNGGTGGGSGIAGWKRGVGGFERTQENWQGPGGSSYNGYTRGQYNAKTGVGSYNANHQLYDAKNGQTYGDTNHTSYSNGQGVTQLDTDHHGDYTIDWGKGEKTSIVRDPAAN